MVPIQPRFAPVVNDSAYDRKEIAHAAPESLDADALVISMDAHQFCFKGNHEDFAWLDEQLKAGRREILPGLTYLPSGDVIDIGEDPHRRHRRLSRPVQLRAPVS